MIRKTTSLAATAALVLAAASPIHAAGTAGDGDGDQAIEMQMLAGAKVPATEAGTAALAAVPGTIAEIGLDAAKDGPVWEVTVIDASGAEILVTVDAGTAKVLSQVAEAQTADAQDDEDEGEQGEGAETGEDSD